MAACALALACAAPSAAAVGDLSYFDCVGQGSFGCTDLNPTAGVLDDAAAVTVVGPDVYAVGEASNAVSHHLRLGGGKLLFTNCIGQGSLGCTDLNPTATAISGPVAIAASPDGKDVYVAGYLADAIAHFARSDATGNLTFKDCVSFNQFGCTKIFATTDALDGPRAIAISPDGADVYVTSDRKNAVLHFTRAADGKLTFADCVAMGAKGCTDISATAFSLDVPLGVAVSPGAGDQVYVTGHDSFALTRFTRGGTGALTFHSCLGQGTFGCTDLGATSALYSAGPLVVNPTGTQIYVVDPGTDMVARFTRSPAGAVAFAACAGQGASAPCTDLNAVTGSMDEPDAVAVSPDGASVYAASRKGSAVTRFTAPLVFANCVGANTFGCQAVDPFGSIGDVTGVAVASSNLDVYATARQSNALVHLRRKAKPACANETARTPQDTAVSVTLVCDDVDGDPLTLSISGAPAHGTLGAIAKPSGKVTYTPAPGFAGTDTFLYGATDVDGTSNVAMMTVTVDPPAAPPGPPPVAPPASPPPPGPAPSTPAPVTPTTAPSLAKAPAADPKFADLVTFPSARRCMSRRRFRIRLRIPAGANIASAAVFVGRKQVKVVRGARLTAPVQLTGLPAGRYTVRIVLTTAAGHKITGSRQYRTCAKKRKAKRRRGP